MLIDFNEISEMHGLKMNDGTGEMSAKMFMDSDKKIITCSIHKGSSIGMHSHPTSDDINFILSGKGKAICDEIEENLNPGICHICKKGSQHSIINTGDEDLVMLTVVIEK